MHNESGGYREQSAMKRDQVAFTTEAFSGKKSRLMASALFTKLYYQTPGGLTPAQFEENPGSARPAAGPNPSAIDAKAAIAQTNLIAGLHHVYQLSDQWQTSTTLYAAFAEINNPSIRNYERRLEPHGGLRSMFVYKKNTPIAYWQWHTGIEYQYGQSSILVANNVNGEPGATQTNDDLALQTGFVFTQVQAVVNNKWQLVAGLSVSRNQFAITRRMDLPVKKQQRNFDSELAPRIELQYRWSEKMRTQVSFSKGYSPPTSAEILPSTGMLDLGLQAESGNNIEVANSWWIVGNKLRWDINAFYFSLNDALVQQRDASGADFFINAGGTTQIGLEQQLSFVQRYAPHRLINQIVMQASHTYSRFRYNDYNKNGTDFSGNKLPGIPEHAIAFNADVASRTGLYLSMNYFFNSRTWLNDANSFSAEPFHLLGFRLGYKGRLTKQINWQLYWGVENLLNESYGLGHDINAFGNRFYNAMPDRNYYFGIALSK